MRRYQVQKKFTLTSCDGISHEFQPRDIIVIQEFNRSARVHKHGYGYLVIGQHTLIELLNDPKLLKAA
jgi:hypothetical protein